VRASGPSSLAVLLVSTRRTHYLVSRRRTHAPTSCDMPSADDIGFAGFGEKPLQRFLASRPGPYRSGQQA
jgi:hypothetical protein